MARLFSLKKSPRMEGSAQAALFEEDGRLENMESKTKTNTNTNTEIIIGTEADVSKAIGENAAAMAAVKNSMRPTTLKRAVLIIEDSAAIRTFMRRALSATGYDVFEAASAFDAYKLLRTHAIDIVTLDLGLPDEDGLEFLRSIQEDEDTIRPVIVCSVRSDRGTRETARKYGAAAYLAKPFDIHELFYCINTILDPTLNSKN